ncbi:MAG: hypothetical protein H6728_09310 [Myxococcales bacterium]|nr:hypothetical protein [Myxococcales bacterium]MCB9643262.1 hypothetical protein [Myxococcales bacterium]
MYAAIISLWSKRVSWMSAMLSMVCLISLGACGGGECRHDADCEGTKVCRDGKCTSNILNPTCTSNADCPTGQSCVKESCVQADCVDGEKQPCYEGPQGTTNVGVCKGGSRTCTGGQWGWCEGQVQPASELCDGLDNNCNGQVDEDPKCSATCTDGETRPCYTGAPGTQDIGTCRQGAETCAGGAWGACAGDIRPEATDKCGDNLDNNCNGQVDENCGACTDGQTRSCYTGAANTRNIGTCKDGTETCTGGVWGACTGETKPETDKCGDNLDNDCNGKIDDAPGCNTSCTDGQTRPCYTGPAGTKGVGVCKEGAEPCQGGQWTGACVGEVKPSGSEICGNNLDDNCNGQADESCGVCRNGDQDVCYTGATGCTKQADGSYACNGACRSGTRSCSGGQWGPCAGETKPKAQETCNNNLDDNCDGQIDEGCGVCTNGQTRACYTGPASTRKVGVCKDGTETCTGGQWGTCVGDVKPSPETCGNAADDNCDGQVDEGCTSSKLHQTCQTGNDCDNGQLCINVGTSTAPDARCFQDCTNRATVCQTNGDGRTACVDFATDSQGNNIQICAKQSAANGSCNVTQSSLCNTGLICSSGTCKPATTVNEGAVCDPSAATPILCSSGNTCVGFGTGFPSICLKNCTTTCTKSGFQCVPLQSGSVSVCLQQGCTTDAQCSYSNHFCAQDSNGQTFCSPEPSPGPVAYGGNCTQSDPNLRCQAGLICLTFTNDTTGICSKSCNTASCPSGSRCETINTSGDMACFVDCSRCLSTQTCDVRINACYPKP